MGDPLDYVLLGRLEVRRDGAAVPIGRPRLRALLGVLLLEANRVVPSERLVELLWGDDDRAVASLQTHVSNLRRVLEPQRRPRDPSTVLLTEAPGYRLVADRRQVDVCCFEDLARRGRELLDQGDAAAALAEADSALQLWQGPPLPEFAYDAFVVDATNRLTRLHLGALSTAAEARLELGDHLGAAGLLQDPAGAHPLDERLHVLLALALYRAGRQTDALRTIDRVRRALSETAGLEPGPELRTLESDILAQSAALDASPVRPGGGGVAPVVVDAAPRPDGARAQDPGPRSSATPLVGRGAELGLLEELLEDAAHGHGRVAVVLGEPGIGKTRLAEELAERARARGVVTAWARCPESGAIPAFWPVIVHAERLRDAGVVAAELVAPEQSDPAGPGDLFALYEGISSALRSSPSPLLLVIDDLQWADADSLRLLAHVAGALAECPVMLLATVRPLVDDSPAALVDGLAALARTAGVLHVDLDGLGEDAVVEWLGQRSDVEVPTAVAATVHQRTGGNPLFVKELSELLATEGRLGDPESVRASRSIPPGVQFVVRRRVARLPPATRQVLGVASVVGRDFELGLVATVAELAPDDVLDALAPALDAALVLDAGNGRFRFSHALVADALAAELNAARRARLHASTARSMAGDADELGDRAALVAHHALAGVAAGTGELARRSSIEAARRAAAGFGFEDAAAHWGRVVDLLEATHLGDLDARFEARYELAAMLFEADVLRDAKDAAIRAIELAETAGDTPGMVRAASLLGHPHLWPNQAYGETDERAVTVLRRIVDVLGSDDLEGRARVLGALAVELTYADPESVVPVRVAAERAARACGDPVVLTRVLFNAIGPLAPSTLELRRATAVEVLELCSRHDLPVDIEVLARFHLALARWEGAEMDVALTELAACRAAADRIGGGPMRSQLGWFEGATAVVRGDYDRARRLGSESAELYRRTRRIDADLIEQTLLFAIALDVGGLDQVIESMLHDPGANPSYGWITSEIVAFAMIEAGHRDVAAAVVAATEVSDPPPDDYTTLMAAVVALHNRAELDVAGPVEPLMELLEPYRGRWAQAGSGGCGGGLVDLGLARGAATLGQTDRARELFEVAVEGHERLGAPAWHARSLVHQAAFLLGTGDPDDLRLGRTALERARSIAAGRGFPYVARRVDELSARLR